MAKKVLVPLDSGTDHEETLRLVADLARGAGATVRLLHVAPVPDNVVSAEGRIVAFADQEMRRLEATWLDSLHAADPIFEGLSVERVMRFGHPVEEILDEAEAFGADLILVGTTCRNAVKRTILGSVAEQVVRRAKASVLLLRPSLA